MGFLYNQNNDFKEFKIRAARAKSRSRVGEDRASSFDKDGDADDILISGSQFDGELLSDVDGPGSKGQNKSLHEKPGTLGPLFEPSDRNTYRKGDPASQSSQKSFIRGGFSVQFKPMGIDENRALYVRDERTIYINIDHPQLSAAKGNESIENPIFLKLSYEIAFSEYSIALAHELNENNEYIDTSDPIISIRETINRISRKAANLYSSN